MHFPVAGITVSPIFPVLLGFVVASICSTCGVSGVFLLVPTEMSFFDFVSPAVSSTSQLYNIIGLPGAIVRYLRDGRMNWGLFWVVVIGVLPGMFVGAVIRIRFLTNPADFKAFIGLVLLYLGLRLLSEVLCVFRRRKERVRVGARVAAAESAAAESAAAREDATSATAPRVTNVPPKEAVITGCSLSWRRIEFDFWERRYSVNTMTVGIMAVVVGVISGIYGIGGSVFTASFLVAVVGLPVYVVAGATLAGACVGSTFGIIFYALLAMTPLGAGHRVAPDLLLGLLMGVGGFAGNYVGAFLQRYVPDRLARGTMGALITGLAVSYVAQFLLIGAIPALQTVRAMF